MAQDPPAIAGAQGPPPTQDPPATPGATGGYAGSSNPRHPSIGSSDLKWYTIHSRIQATSLKCYARIPIRPVTNLSKLFYLDGSIQYSGQASSDHVLALRALT